MTVTTFFWSSRFCFHHLCNQRLIFFASYATSRKWKKNALRNTKWRILSLGISYTYLEMLLTSGPARFLLSFVIKYSFLILSQWSCAVSLTSIWCFCCLASLGCWSPPNSPYLLEVLLPTSLSCWGLWFEDLYISFMTTFIKSHDCWTFYIIHCLFVCFGFPSSYSCQFLLHLIVKSISLVWHDLYVATLRVSSFT